MNNKFWRWTGVFASFFIAGLLNIGTYYYLIDQDFGLVETLLLSGALAYGIGFMVDTYYNKVFKDGGEDERRQPKAKA